MTLAPPDIIAARRKLGAMWGLGREVSYGELACALEMHGPAAGGRNTYHERGRDLERRGANGPQSVAILGMLNGFIPEGAPPEAHRRAALHG